MRMRTMILGLALVVATGLLCQASAQAVAQNANKPAAKKAKPAAKPAEAKPAPAAAAPAAAAGQTMAAKPKPKPKRKPSTAMKGVPNGVPNCIKHLQKMAEKDPLIAYDGHPSEIVNDGLLWNDPKSHCSVASDAAMKQKVVQLANAWRAKDASTVRSLLADLASSGGSN
ncbi:MAG TPA: hypothetical protein VNS63_03025 [Blastocatellia bacterium]|nr:hypothetical protein [Blastocatellia bacterium]